MRDIVATIQPEQDELVRADLDDSICVQGAPGTGKTAVGLHRAAYLLYLHRERLRRSGVLIVGPNRAFLSLHLGGAAGARRGRGRAGHRRRPGRPGAGPRRSTRPRWPPLKHDARMAAGAAPALWTRLIQRPTSRSWCRTARAAGGSSGRRCAGSSTRPAAESLPYGVGRERVRARVVGAAAAPGRGRAGRLAAARPGCAGWARRRR